MLKQDAIHPLLLMLLEESQQLFGFKIISWQRVSLGWLNLKWKLETEQGDLLLKLYHANRYTNADVLNRALQQQQRLHDSGVPCPKLLSIAGDILHSFSDERYIIMPYCTGKIVGPEDVNRYQMYELGYSVGKMHQVLNDGSLGEEGSAQFIPQNREERINHWSNVIKEAKSNKKTHLISDIEMQLKLTKTIDIDSFGNYIPRWTHRDLWVDNLLFTGDKVSAILDFDRLNYDFTELDVARAIMSWAFNNGNFCTELAAAFLEGYRTVYEYPSGQIVNSLRMLWYLESVWWISANMEHHNKIQARFAEEMNWLAKMDDHLPVILSDL